MNNKSKNAERKFGIYDKHYKVLRYSRNLMLAIGTFGASTGMLWSSNTVKTNDNNDKSDGNIKNAFNKTKTLLKTAKAQNKKYMRGANLELIQLMEQGDHVVKSPWSSWQFGMNFFSNAHIVSEDGHGDKQDMYQYNGLYFRNNWKMKNALASSDALGAMGMPITPGSDSQTSWKNANGDAFSSINFDMSNGSSVNGEVRWGLVELRKVQEPLNEVEILARISPKEVKKEAVSLNVAEPTVEIIEAPVINPQVNTPLAAPNITIPSVTAPTIPAAPAITITVTPPTITALSISTPAQVTLEAPVVDTPSPVAFSVAPTIDAKDNRPGSRSRKISNNQIGVDSFFPSSTSKSYDVDTVNKSVRNFFTFGGVSGGVTLPGTGTINVKIDDTRAIVVDEPQNGSKFKMQGTINLYGSKNMGIDLQGSANKQSGFNGTDSTGPYVYQPDKVAFAEVENNGKIIGSYQDKNGNSVNKNQIAFGFSNLDSSFNNTMTHIINSGTISLNAPESAGIQLKPEDPHNWTPHWSEMTTVSGKDVVKINDGGRGTANKGIVLMKADNQEKIEIESSGSFGIITVFNPGISELTAITSLNTLFNNKTQSNLRAQRNLGGVKILPGGEIGRSGLTDAKYTSGVYNSGTISINGDKSVGVGILQEIQEVKVGGKIDIGTTASLSQGVNQNLAGGNNQKVENAVGIYAAVPTMPVLSGTKDTLGNTATADIGTKTVEFGPFGKTGASVGAAAGSGTITIGENATKSIGLLVGDSEENLNDGKLNGAETTGRKLRRSGSITANEGANVVVNGDSNYGFVVKSESYKSIFDLNLIDNLLESTDRTNYGVGINKGTITVNGTNSIAFAMLKGGDSSNSGDLIVNPLTAAGAQSSTAFYGEQGNFANSGNITVNTPANTGNIGVLLKGPNTTTPINFTNKGNISVQGEGNIGVYGEGKYTFNHEKNTAGTNKISVGSDAIGIYAREASGTLNIKAPIDIAASGTGTTIGIYTDGNAKVKFGEHSKLTIGVGAVGIYSSDATKFNNTFEIANGKTLEVDLGKNSTFGLLNGNNTVTTSPLLSKYLNNGITDKINITGFAEGASLFYSTSKAKAILDEDYTITNGGAAKTSVLVANDGARVEIASGKTLTTNTNVGLIATKGTGTGAAASTAQNDGSIISTRDSGIGIYTTESIGNSTGIITMQKVSSVGILGENNSTLTNSGKIELLKDKSAGIYGKDSNITNTGTGTDKGIYVKDEKSAGIFGEISGNADKTINNNGNITTEKTESAGIYGKINSGVTNKLSIINGAAGNITVNGDKSVGLFANNLAGTVANLTINNTGKININNGNSVGIYAPKATVSGVGKVILKDDAVTNGSIAVYGSDGSKITSDNGDISLGKVSQQRVAYYIKDTATQLKGTNIGKVSGYGVGVYLDGSNLNHTDAPILDYTGGADKGNGIIGLFLKNTTNISTYTKAIKVGDSVNAGTANAKYAIAIYADRQGTTANKYEIKAPITTGANGIGIFVGKDDTANTGSSIKYLGAMNIGDGTTSGTGIYIADKPGTGDNEATLGSTSHIKLNGTNGVGVIIGKGAKLSIESGTKIEIAQNANNNFKGVGIYGLKGSQIDASNGITNLTFINNGNTAEIVRTVEGKANITGGSTTAKPGIVVTHVINGETSLAGGATISAVDDTPYTASKNIGLMAQGIKNPTAPAPFTSWDKGNYEIVNDGTIDFQNSEYSTGIYVESARAQLGASGIIKLGKGSTGIYGIYRSDSPHYDGGSSSNNKLSVESTANSMMELGQESVGVYLKNASTGINLDGKITSSAGVTKNVGVYMINEAGTQPDQGQILTGMVTGSNSEITLGDGSVGLYSRGKGSAVADRNTVTNNGKITVGKKIAGAPSVGIYAENTNLSTGTSSDVTVGEDGIAFYGKNSEIIANGTANFNNKGVLAYLEDSKFVSHLGNISPTQNTMIYLKNSTAEMDGIGTKVDMTVADGYTGAYVGGIGSKLTGVKTIRLGKNSNGVFLKDAVFTSEIEEITGTQENSKGILGIDSSLINKTKISLSGDNSIAIYSNADSTKSVVNEGNLILSGKKTLGVFLKGSQSFENKADISIADSADSQNPVIGVYTASGTSPITLTSGNIEVGMKSIGVYSTTDSAVTMTGGNLHVKDEGMGIYKKSGSVTLGGNIVMDAHTSVTQNTEPVGVYAVNGATVNDGANVSVGEKSYGFILNNDDPSKVNVYTNTAGTGAILGNDSTYLYSGGKAQITNNKDISSGNMERLIGFYIKGNSTGSGNFVNNGLLDFSTGKGNIGVYAPGSTATNTSAGKIYVGKTDDIDPLTGNIYSDKSRIVYGIGMATDNGGHIINDGEIRVFENKSIGMYGSGSGTVVENTGNILLDGSRATSTNKIQSMTGVYVDEGAKFINRGTIQTTDSYAGRNGMVNPNVSGLVGVAVMNGSTLINEAGGKILIDADNSYGVIIRGKKNPDGTVQYATIKNYGEIKVRGKGTFGISWKDVTADEIAALENQINSMITSDPRGQEIRGASGTDKDFEGISISIKNGEPIFTRNGVPVSDSEVAVIEKLIGKESNLGLSDIGFYVDTLGRTRPIDIDGTTPPINSQLIIGTEYSEMTNSKYWVVKGDVIKPFLDQIEGRNFKLTSLAGSLTWMATPILNSYGEMTGVAMAKVPYTSFVKKTDNAWNFTDGLEQRYGVNALDSREKLLFNKLNSIGNNEPVLLTQAFDEMMGHQYANIQQRIHRTGRLIDKEISHLSKEWETKSRQSNKIKAFGMKDEYSTDTAGIIDYDSNAYGFAYLHENEGIKLGHSSGWYAGAVHDKLQFKDIGKSKENRTMLKAGVFKTMSPAKDHNGSLQWKVSGEGYVTRNDMHRKYLVVDEIFNAKSDYTSYGVAIGNEVSYNVRTSERTSIRPYGNLKIEYGRFNGIKEKTGEMRLDVKGNDYYSIRPEVGVNFIYRQPFALKSMFVTTLGLGYENELGKVGNVDNKARVSYTEADWFGIRGEKDNRKGNFKADLNIGIENQRIGFTLNGGYDTSGKNVRGGIGIRVIY